MLSKYILLILFKLLLFEKSWLKRNVWSSREFPWAEAARWSLSDRKGASQAGKYWPSASTWAPCLLLSRGRLGGNTPLLPNWWMKLYLFFITVFPGDSKFHCCLIPHVHCLQWPLSFYGFSAWVNVFPGLSICIYSGTGLPAVALVVYSAMWLPYLRVIPVSTECPGIPLCVLTPYFPKH